MKKISSYFLVIILSILIFLVGFNYKDNKQPNVLYKVYLDKEYIGMIESKKELEDYINNQANTIRDNIKKYKLKIDAIETFTEYEKSVELSEYDYLDKVNYLLTNKKRLNISDSDIDLLKLYQTEKLYNLNELEIEEMKQYISNNDIYMHVEDVYTPNGIEIKRVYTYDDNILTASEAYRKIISKKAFSIAGYKFTIKSNNEEIKDIVLYTLDTQVFSDAVEDLITIFVDEKDYEKYKNDTQASITTTGTLIEKIYIDEDITYKATNVPVDEKIYTDSNNLSAYLLYGDTYTERFVTVKPGDSIESIANENQISVQEFLIFNNRYNSRDNLLVPNTEVKISTVDPKIQVVVEYYEVVDKETSYSTDEKYDENLTQGSVVVTQEGKNGLERVSQNVKSVNGNIAYVDPVEKAVIQNSIPQIISIGTKFIPNIGSTASWEWPTNQGYTFSSYYGYRLSVFGEGNFHSGLDIAGTGYGSPVYAANNGTIHVLKDLGGYSYGKHIIINHNNGYYTVYAHMSSFASNLSVGSTVSRGQVIGYVGSSGWATGPHLHYEIRTCEKYACITNPLNYYR